MSRDIYGDFHIYCMSKIIFTSKGQEITVDDEDYEYLDQYKWCAHKNFNTYYAERNSPTIEEKRTIVRMHRVIMNAQKGEFVDHINGNGLDNRKENLRLCTNTENVRNARLSKRNTSGYKGVTWCIRDSKWMAQIWISRKRKYLGRYSSKEEAAKAYDEAAIKYFGEFARLNFPLK